MTQEVSVGHSLCEGARQKFCTSFILHSVREKLLQATEVAPFSTVFSNGVHFLILFG